MRHKEPPIYLDTETNGLVWPALAKMVVAKDTTDKDHPTWLQTMLFTEEDSRKIENFIRGSAYRDWETDRKSTRLNSSHSAKSRMPSSA